MTSKPLTEAESPPINTDKNSNPEPELEKILCPHCQRTATNGIKCQGICIADSDY